MIPPLVHRVLIAVVAKASLEGPYVDMSDVNRPAVPEPLPLRPPPLPPATYHASNNASSPASNPAGAFRRPVSLSHCCCC